MKKHIDAFIGIDYGTTSCKMAFITPPHGNEKKKLPQVANISFNMGGVETSKRYPSAILFERKNNKVRIKQGFEVQNLFKDDKKLNSMDYELVTAPKMDLGKGIFYPIAPPEYSEPQDLISLTLREMLKEFEQTSIKVKNCKIIVTVPSSFGVQQRKEILEAIENLGIEAGQDCLIDEPNAALLGLITTPLFSTVIRRAETKHVLLIDFGGGTCDISLLKISEDYSNPPYGVDINNLAINDYYELGGNKIDQELADLYCDQIFTPGTLDLFNQDILKIEAIDKLKSRLAKTIGQKSKEQIINELSGKGSTKQRSLKEKFLFNIEKIRILFRPLGEPLEISRKNKILVQREAFENIVINKINGDLIDINTLISNVVEKAGIEFYDIGAVVLAGGSSRIFQVPQFKKELMGIFPHLKEDKFVSVPDPDLLISIGAALECYNRFFLKKSLIRPICPSNIRIRTAEGDSVCLIPAGKGLPFPNPDDRSHEEILYVPNTREKAVKVPLYIEKFDNWHIFEVWDIILPSGINPSDKLLFGAKMNSEKILEVFCRAKKDPNIKFRYSSENWLSNAEYNPREQKINALRIKLKNQKKLQDKINFTDAYNLIWEEYKGGYAIIARKRCLSFLEAGQLNNRDTAQLYNILGLMAGVKEEALQYYLKALQLQNNNSVFNYNVGVTYLWYIQDFILAEKYLSVSLDIYKEYKTLYYLARAQGKNKKENEAKELYREGMRLVREEFGQHPGGSENIEFYCKFCDQSKLGISKRISRSVSK